MPAKQSYPTPPQTPYHPLDHEPSSIYLPDGIANQSLAQAERNWQLINNSHMPSVYSASTRLQQFLNVAPTMHDDGNRLDDQRTMSFGPLLKGLPVDHFSAVARRNARRSCRKGRPASVAAMGSGTSGVSKSRGKTQGLAARGAEQKGTGHQQSISALLSTVLPAAGIRNKNVSCRTTERAKQDEYRDDVNLPREEELQVRDHDLYDKLDVQEETGKKRRRPTKEKARPPKKKEERPAKGKKL